MSTTEKEKKCLGEYIKHSSNWCNSICCKISQKECLQLEMNRYERGLRID